MSWSNARWRKSSRSGSTSDCVELAHQPEADVIGVRDSKNPAGAVLAFPSVSVSSLVAALGRRSASAL